MIITKKQMTLEKFGSGKIWDFPMPGEPVRISYQEHDGRVPEKEWGINTVCWEAYYIVSGKADVFIDDEHFSLAEGDVVILKPNQKSYLVAQHLKLVTVTQPNWYSEQYREIL